jgi:lincosamide nucleotidyltransferase A/C/D/E
MYAAQVERAVYEERDPRRAMSADDVVRLLELMEGIDVWLDGGWGVDALLGEETREHDDLDLVLAATDVPRLVDALSSQGYEVAKGELPTCIVLLDPEGRQVDLHPVTFDVSGDGIYVLEEGGTWPYPARGFAGRGHVLGREVRCLTPEVQVLCHAGYVLGETDFHDLAALREGFGISTGT